MSSISVSDDSPAWRHARRGRILAAARTVLQDRQLEDVSMDAIARAAGVGKATLYRYFDSRDALLGACLEDIVEDLGARMEAAEDTDAAARCRLRAMIAAMVGTFSAHLLPLQVLARRQGDLHEAWRQHVRGARERLVRVLGRHFESGLAEGAYRDVDTELMPHLVMGMVRSCVTHTGLPDERIVDGICRFVDGAVAAPAAGEHRHVAA